MAVTKEQILSAADELAAAGQKPTLEAIRQITGGSYTTISPALNEWKARQATAAQPLREPAPQAVADRLAEVGAEVWGIALELANARLASEREALEKARADLEADRAEATELADRLAAQVEELQSRLASIEAAEAAARGEADALRDELAAMRERAATAEARAGELRTELDHAHTDAAAQRAKLEKAEAHGFGLTDRVNELQALVYEANAELATVKGKAEAADQAHQEQRQQAAADAQRHAEQLAATQAERDQARQEAGAAREEAARLAGQLQAHQEQTAAIPARLAPAAEAKPEDAGKPTKGRK